MLRAESYFEELRSTVERGQNLTDLLHVFVDKANQEEQYTHYNEQWGCEDSSQVICWSMERGRHGYDYR